MYKNVASQSLTLYAVDASTGLPKTGDAANQVYYVSIDDGAVTAITSNSGVPTEIDSTNAKGLYKIALSQAETNGNKLLFSGKSSTTNIVVVPAVIYTDPANYTLFAIDGSGRIDLGKWIGTAPASLTAAFYVKADVEQWIGSAPSTLVNGNVLADLRAWRGIQPNSLVSGQVQASDSVASGTVTSATASTIVVPVSSGAANLWRGLRITIRGAPGTGQSRLITADDGAGNLTIAPNWITNPTGSSLFTIDEWSGVDVLTWLEGTVNALISGRVDANTQAMGTDAISSAAVSQAAANKVADSTLRRHNVNVEGSSDGDALAFRSLYGGVAKLTNKTDINTGTGNLEIKESDDNFTRRPNGFHCNDTGNSTHQPPLATWYAKS